MQLNRKKHGILQILRNATTASEEGQKNYGRKDSDKSPGGGTIPWRVN